MFKLKFTPPLLALALATVAPQAMAEDVVFPGFAHGSQSVTINLSIPNVPVVNKTVSAGGFSTSLNGGPSFESFCVDVYHWINFGVHYNDYTLPGTSHSFINGDAYTDLGRLWFKFGSTLTDAVHEAAFQMAVWEIAYETDSSYDLGHGQATFAGTVGAMNLATAWLGNLGTTGFDIRVLDSKDHQDVITPVPEPEIYALMVMGLLGMTFVARRRGARASAHGMGGSKTA